MRVIIFVMFLCGGSIAAQPITFFKEYGGSKSDYAHSVALTADGGYAVVGSTSSFEIGPTNVYLIKTDSFGEIIWENTYGDIHADQGFDIQETFDEGYVVAGALGEPDSMSAHYSSFFVFKTNPQGIMDWSFSWNPESGNRAFFIQQNEDSTYIAGGALNTGIHSGNPVPVLIKLDTNGDSLWHRRFASPGAFSSSIPTFDKGYISCGHYGLSPAAFTYLVKTNSIGDTLWTKTANLGFQYGHAADIIQLSDSSFIITGTAFNNVAVRNVFLAKIDKLGNWLWTKFYGGFKDDIGVSVDQDNNGGFIITGSTFSYTPGPFTNTNIWLIKTDSQGDTLWTRSYGGNEVEISHSVKRCPDGGYVATGSSSTYSEIFLLKTDSLGNAPTITSVSGLLPTKEPAITVYPNPSKDWITLEFDEAVYLDESQLSIYTSSGIKVESFKMNRFGLDNNHFQMNVSNLTKGLYFLRFDWKGGTQLIKFLKI
ncbi:MAG: T9SS type A sorting domain-containing protein [Chitinophagales bacterium]|nr:T9SS type A sorting domain-containing protein [Chitinophagales bacterium]